MKNDIFWDVTLCGYCKNRRSGGTQRRHHQGDKKYLLCSVRWLLVMANVPSSPILVTLMKEAQSPSETSVLTRTTRLNIPEDTIFHSHRRENLKSYTILPGSLELCSVSCCVCVADAEDELAHWWSGVVGVAAYWLLGEDAQAERLYPRVETLPESLDKLTDPLPRAVLAAFRSHRALLSSSHHCPGINHNILRLCNTAGQYLDDSLTYSSCKQTNSTVHVSAVEISSGM
jgi:hypothetical protein